MKRVMINTSKAILLYILVVLFLVFEMGVQVSPSIMTNQLMHDLHISTFGLGLMSGFYFYTYAAMQIPSGLLYDKFNPRYIITTSILICTLGTFLFGIADNIFIGCFARLLMGCGSAFAFISVLVIISDLFQTQYFALLTGITQMLAALGAMAGQIPLSKLISLIGWRDSMFVLTTIGLILTIVTFSFVRYKRCPKSISHYETPEQNVITNLKTILTNKQTWFIALYACLMWAPMSGFASLWGVSFLKVVHGLNHATATKTCAFMWLGLALCSPVLCWFSTTMHRRLLPLIFSAIFGAIAFVFLIFYANAPYWLLVIFVFISGAACSGQALSFSVVKENNSRQNRATAIGFNNMAVVISGALFQPLIGKILQFHTNPSVLIIKSNNISQINTFKISMIVILLSYIIATTISLLKINETFCNDKLLQ